MLPASPKPHSLACQIRSYSIFLIDLLQGLTKRSIEWETRSVKMHPQPFLSFPPKKKKALLQLFVGSGSRCTTVWASEGWNQRTTCGCWTPIIIRFSCKQLWTISAPFFFSGTHSLCSPGCPGNYHVSQSSLGVVAIFPSAFQLQAWATHHTWLTLSLYSSILQYQAAQLLDIKSEEVALASLRIWEPRKHADMSHPCLPPCLDGWSCHTTMTCHSLKEACSTLMPFLLFWSSNSGPQAC